MVKDKYLTIGQVSEQYNKKPHQVRYAIKTKKLQIVKPNWEIFILKDSIPKEWKKNN
ncbi:MAG: hypothetical protein M0Q88_08645 [Bacilli bacterium]|nr:hypothetical protein [Bacilli bacterium]